MAATCLTLLLEMPSAKLESRLLAYLAGSKQRAKSMEAPDMSDKMLKKWIITYDNGSQYTQYI